MFNLEQGKTYIRKELHRLYGGNPQSGIAPSAKTPCILIFTGKSGKKHGYEDTWDGDIFYYTGEGQTGDMIFTKGNKAILDHKEDNKRIFLFEGIGKGNCIFLGELEYDGFDYFSTHDTEGKIRNAIQFRLKRIGSEDNEPRSGSNITSKPNRTERTGLITSRVGQGQYRIKLLDKWDRKCAVTGVDSANILIASHILPWKDSNDEQRLDTENGILLSPSLDALFDRHLISFNDKGEIILSNIISEEHYKSLGVHKKMKLRNVSERMKQYLQQHRERMKELYQ